MLRVFLAFLLILAIGRISADTLVDYAVYLKDLPINLSTWESTKQKGNQVQIQSDADLAILMHTLFPSLESAKRVNALERYEETLKKSEVLSRILIAMKVARLHLITAKEKHMHNNSKGVVWPYPLATAFGHGQRVLVTLNGVHSDEFLSFLFGNVGNHRPEFVKKRAVSSHGVKQNADGSVEEVKMGNILGAATNLFKGAQGKHLYINYSWGGLGQIGPDGLLNGISGKRYDPKTGNADDSTKLGHLYLFHENLDKGISAVLFGVETCSPGSKNPYGVSHGIQSGMQDLKKNRPVNGGSKMQVLFDQEHAPTEYGGMRLAIDKQLFAQISSEWESYKRMAPGQKVQYMRQLLSNNGDGAHPYIPEMTVRN